MLICSFYSSYQILSLNFLIVLGFLHVGRHQAKNVKPMFGAIFIPLRKNCLNFVFIALGTLQKNYNFSHFRVQWRPTWGKIFLEPIFSLSEYFLTHQPKIYSVFHGTRKNAVVFFGCGAQRGSRNLNSEFFFS